MTTTTDLPDGYYQVPHGKLANAVTWLEMRYRPAAPIAPPLALTAVPEPDSEECREMFRRIGTPWLWSRAHDGPGPLPTATFFALDDEGRPVGVVELSAGNAADIEIAFFGLVPEAIGRGLGRRMMAAALDLAWQTAERVWLHTCNFDHPGALRFYQACGFVPYASGFEIMRDPRLDGSLPVDAAPHIPCSELRPSPNERYPVRLHLRPAYRARDLD